MNNYTAPKSDLADDNEEEYVLTKDEKNMAMLCHVSSLCWLIGIPSVVGPLVMWLSKKDESEFIDVHGKEALNFHISLIIYSAISGVLIFLFFVGLIGFLIIGIMYIVCTIQASMKASEGEEYYYPMTIRFIS